MKLSRVSMKVDVYMTIEGYATFLRALAAGAQPSLRVRNPADDSETLHAVEITEILIGVSKE